MNSVFLAVGILGFASDGISLKVGDPAPPIVARNWINLGDHEVPSLESLRGKVVLLEFWGTWCNPCVLTMPHIQELHERYARHGVVVLAISNELVDELRPFLDRHNYTMIVGADSDLQTIEPYGVQSWPTTYLVGRDGMIAWKGGPYGVEVALDQLLGLPSDPGAMLDAFLEAEVGGMAQRQALERLARLAPSQFDLKGWSGARPLRSAPVDSNGVPIARPPPRQCRAFPTHRRDRWDGIRPGQVGP